MLDASPPPPIFRAFDRAPPPPLRSSPSSVARGTAILVRARATCDGARQFSCERLGSEARIGIVIADEDYCGRQDERARVRAVARGGVGRGDAGSGRAGRRACDG